MPIDALLALQAVAFLLEVAADGHPVFLVKVEVFAILTAFALPFEPVDAHDFFVLRLVRL